MTGTSTFGFTSWHMVFLLSIFLKNNLHWHINRSRPPVYFKWVRYLPYFICNHPKPRLSMSVYLFSVGGKLCLAGKFLRRWNYVKLESTILFEVSTHNLEISQTWGFLPSVLPFCKRLFMSKLEFSSLIDCLIRYLMDLWNHGVGMIFFVRFSSFSCISNCCSMWKRCIYA